MKEELLQLLAKDARRSIIDLAVMLDVSEDDVINEMEKLEKEKVICGYQTLINWDKTERETITALIEVKVNTQKGRGFDSIAERIYKFKEVKAVYLMSGGFDFTVIVEEKTMKEVALFVSNKLAPLESVLSTATCFVMKRYKDHGIIIDGPKVDKRMIVTP